VPVVGRGVGDDAEFAVEEYRLAVDPFDHQLFAGRVAEDEVHRGGEAEHLLRNRRHFDLRGQRLARLVEIGAGREQVVDHVARRDLPVRVRGVVLGVVGESGHVEQSRTKPFFVHRVGVAARLEHVDSGDAVDALPAFAAHPLRDAGAVFVAARKNDDP